MIDFLQDHPKGCGIGAVIIILLVILFAIITGSYKRVDSGYAGIVVDYAAGTTSGHPVVHTLSSGQYASIAPFSGQQFIEYPIAMQQLVLASRNDEGEFPGDSTIACQMAGGGVLNMGLTVNWQVNPDHPEILYLKKPGIPLTSSLNGDINTTLVYGAVQSDLLDLCTHYSWQEILGDGTGPTQVDIMKTQLLANLKADLAQDGIVVNQIFFKERRPDATIQAVLNARNDAQKSAYLQQEAQYQANAAIAKAQGDAQAIAIINKQLASSHDYLTYLAIKEWDGKLPQYLSTNGGNPILSVAGK